MGFVLWSQLFLWLVSDYTGGGRHTELLSRITSAGPDPGCEDGWPQLYLHFSEYLSQKIISVFKENAVKWGFNVTSRQRRSHGKVEEFVSLRICGKICRVIRGMFMMSPYKSRLSHNSYISPQSGEVTSCLSSFPIIWMWEGSHSIMEHNVVIGNTVYFAWLNYEGVTPPRARDII